jgi:hypothetical protein
MSRRTRWPVGGPALHGDGCGQTRRDVRSQPVDQLGVGEQAACASKMRVPPRD